LQKLYRVESATGNPAGMVKAYPSYIPAKGGRSSAQMFEFSGGQAFIGKDSRAEGV
jgi:hypothetical protein